MIETVLMSHQASQREKQHEKNESWRITQHEKT